jgi:hypothetical protein
MQNDFTYTKKGIAALKFSDVMIVVCLVFAFAGIAGTCAFLNRPDGPNVYRVDPSLATLRLDISADDGLLLNGEPTTLDRLRPLLAQARDQHRAVILHERSRELTESKSAAKLNALLTELQITAQVQFDLPSQPPPDEDKNRSAEQVVPPNGP